MTQAEKAKYKLALSKTKLKFARLWCSSKIHDHAGDMHRHTINQNLKNEDSKRSRCICKS